MMNNNKVLTVSYGTFSCTLEGFEDSFETMKAIAEYFRDLASDDRYFGAEPPQPDAEMLARIAENEIARRVQASLDGGRVVLSAAPEAPAPEVETPAPAENAATPAPAPAPVPETAPAPLLDSVPQEDPEPDVASEVLVPAAATVAAGSSIADKLARIRAVVANNDNADGTYSEDQHADGFKAADMPDLTRPAEDEHVHEEVEEEAVSEEPLPALQDILAEQAPEEEPEAEIAQADEALPAETVEPAAENIDPDADDAKEPVLADAEAEEALEEEAAAELEVEDTPDEEAPAQNDVLLLTDAAEEDEEVLEAGSEDFAIAAEDDPDGSDAEEKAFPIGSADTFILRAAMSRDASANDDDAETAELDNPADATEDTQDDLDQTTAQLENQSPEMAQESTEAEAEALRIFKAKLSNLEAAIEAVNLVKEETLAEEPSDGALSAEAEADLLRTLEEVEADLPETEQDAVAETEANIYPADAPEMDVDRLMAKAEFEMGEPEGIKNREAFARLRAAVAVRKTDGGLTEDPDEASEHSYRSDLADAVKPRRPAPFGTARDERPMTQPTPLKLVAEQRVDLIRDDEAPGPVRPRRIANEGLAVTDGGFASYAEDMGANSLPQLLEAAAAYLSFVEERETFSRPQIMNKVRTAQGSDFSREDGLRSFGHLLRTGKIEKLKGGRFAATGEIGYRPDAREAG